MAPLEISPRIISRYDALVLIGRATWAGLTVFERLDVLQDYHKDESVLNIQVLTSEDYYKYAILTRDVELSNDDLHDIYSHKFSGVKNEYLETLLVSHDINVAQVEGDVECLRVCDCCHFKTIDCNREAYDICRVCHWEELPPAYWEEGGMKNYQDRLANDPEKLTRADLMYYRRDAVG